MSSIYRVPVCILLAQFLVGSNAIAQSASRTNAYLRWQWMYRQRAYPLSEVPSDGLQTAAAQIRSLKPPLTLEAATPSAERWINIGPAPILGGQTTPASPVSGRVVKIVVNPLNTNHWLISAAGGGVWETPDSGGSWRPRTDGEISLAMGAIAFAPSNTNIIYAGTGEAELRGTYAGQGLLKSIDGGNSWQTFATNDFSRTSFTEIRVHPSNPNVVLAATVNGTGGRETGVVPSPPPTGLFKSIDGGTNWAVKLNGEVTDLEPNPGDFSSQFAAVGSIYGNVSNGVYRSMDSGESWLPVVGPWGLPTAIGRIRVAMAPSDTNVVYVSISKVSNTFGNLLGVWKTSNAWSLLPVWTQLPQPSEPVSQDQWDYDHESIVDPNNANIFYLAGQENFWRYNGTNWTNIAPGTHSDYHALAWAGSRLVQGNDGGVWSSLDGGDTWLNNNKGLAITTFYYGSIHPSNPNLAIGGSQDNGTEIWRGSNSWQWIYSGDGADNAFSPTHPATNWVVSSQQLGIGRTVDGGNNFDEPTVGLNKTGAPFIAAFRICPSNEDIFITGTTNLWKCTNFFSAPSPTWFVNGPALSVPVDGTAVSAMAFAPSDGTGGTYVFAKSSGQLRLTSDGGTVWRDIGDPSILPQRYVTALAFHPTDANILYATFSGFNQGTPGQPGHVFKTTNALAATPNWTNATTPVNLPHNAIAIDPADANTIYVGTDLGIWRSRDAGGNWARLGPETGLPNVAVYDIKISPQGRVVAFTNGRSAFALIPDPQRRLEVARSGSNVVISWSTLALNMALQAADRLDVPASWNEVTNPPVISGTQYYFTNAIANGSLFFRLKSR